MNHLLWSLVGVHQSHCCSGPACTTSWNLSQRTRSSLPFLCCLYSLGKLLPPQKSGRLSNRQGSHSPCLKVLRSSLEMPRLGRGVSRGSWPSPFVYVFNLSFSTLTSCSQPIFYGLCFVSGCLVLRKEWGFQEERPVEGVWHLPLQLPLPPPRHSYTQVLRRKQALSHGQFQPLFRGSQFPLSANQGLVCITFKFAWWMR